MKDSKITLGLKGMFAESIKRAKFQQECAHPKTETIKNEGSYIYRTSCTVCGYITDFKLTSKK